MSPRSDSSPVVAVTASIQDVRYGDWHRRATLVPTAYLDMLQGAGAVPVLVEAGETQAAAVVARRVDALVLTGGVDVDPARYGAVAHGATQAGDCRRDRFETALLEACTAEELPVLAICRGLQVLNVARGGTLHQHLPDLVGNDNHLQGPGAYGRHRVTVDPASQLARRWGRVSADVPTHHHQAVDQVGSGLVPCAWADDGVVEGVEDPERPFVLGVQWHPEVGDDPSLFVALVEAAASRVR